METHYKSKLKCKYCGKNLVRLYLSNGNHKCLKCGVHFIFSGNSLIVQETGIKFNDKIFVVRSYLEKGKSIIVDTITGKTVLELDQALDLNPKTILTKIKTILTFK